MSEDKFTIMASDIEHFQETGEPPKDLADLFEKVLDIFRCEGISNFVLGKVIIENDLEEEDPEMTDENDEDPELYPDQGEHADQKPR